MQNIEFLGLNFIIVSSLGLGVVIYLVILIHKRRRDKFLHQEENEAGA